MDRGIKLKLHEETVLATARATRDQRIKDMKAKGYDPVTKEVDGETIVISWKPEKKKRSVQDQENLNRRKAKAKKKRRNKKKNRK